MTTFKLTRRGRKAHLDGLRPELTLLMEITRHLNGGRGEFDADNELVARYGSIGNAIVAVKGGRVGFEKIE